MQTFEQRSAEFQKEIGQLQTKYGVQLYAAYVVNTTGEIGPAIKLINTLPQTEVMEQKTYANKPKEGHSLNKKTPEITN